MIIGQGQSALIDSYRARIAALEAENARLKEALKPFAEELSNMASGADIERWSDGLSIDDSTNDPSGITLGDLRRARAALTREET